MHSKLSAPGETVPKTRPPSRIRGIARLEAFVILLVSLLFSASPGFAQTALTPLTSSVVKPTYVAIATDGSGTKWLYVSNHGDVPVGGSSTTAPTNGGQILKFNLTTGATTPTVIMQRYDAVTNPNGFISPDGIAVEPSTGDLFIADRYLNRVQRITNTGTFVMRWGSGVSGAPDEMHGPVGVALDGSGSSVAVYVTEHGDTNGSGAPAPNMVAKYTFPTTLTASRAWRVGGSGSGNGQFNTPYAALVNGTSLLVSDGFNYRVQLLSTATGAYQSQFPLDTGAIPLGMTISGSTLYQAEGSTDNTVARVNRRTTTTFAQTAAGPWGSFGSAVGQFDLPFSVAVDSTTNRAYVADYNNSRVQVFDLSATPPADTTPPTVAVTGGSGSSSPATFSVTFSEAVTGVSAGVFTATPSAGVTLGTLVVTPNSSSSYTVSVPFTATSGTITLALNSTANTSIKDTAGNAYAGGATSGGSNTATFTITSSGGGGGTPTLPAGPVISSFALDTTTGAIVTAPGPLASHASMIVTFNGAVTGVDAADFDISGPAQITTVAPISTSQYRVNFNYTNDNPAYVQMAIKTASTGIVAGSDAFYGRGVTATSAAPIQNPSFVDSPTVSSFTAGTPTASSVTLTLTFSAAVSGVDATDFLVAKTGTIVPTVGTPTSSGGGTTWSIPVSFTGTGSFELFLAGGSTTNIKTVASPSVWYDGSGSSTSAVVTVGSSGGTAPTIAATQTATTGTVNTAYSYQVQATNATTFTITSGTLPAGLTMSSTGLISGTPTAATTGTTVTVQVSNTSGNASGQVTIAINAASGGTAPTIAATQTATTGTVNTAYSYQVQATNATTFTITSGTLPAGLTMSSTGLISGTPTAATTGATITVRVSNTTGNASGQVTIAINAAPSVPVVSNASVSGQVGTAIAAVQVQATNSPTSFSASGLATYGLSISSTGLITGTPTQVASGATVSVTASNSAGTSAAATITLNISAAPPPSGGGGGGGGGGTISLPQTIVFAPPSELLLGASITLTATSSSGAPATFTVLSGNATLNGNLLTPTGPGAIVVRASVPASGFYQAGSADATIRAKSNQTIAFNSPVSGVVINTPITLSATSSAGLPITFTLLSGSATLNGNVLTPTGPGAIVVRAASAGNDTTAAASTDVNFGNPQKAAQAIDLASLSDRTTAAGPITLPAKSSAGITIAYSVSGPASLQGGNTIVLNGAPGTITVHATAAGNDSFNAADTSRSFNVRAIGQQVYLGKIGTDTFAVAIAQDNSKGEFVTRFAATGEAIVAKFKLNADGTFSTNGVSSLPASSQEAGTPAVAALVSRTINGTVSNGVVTGTIAELGTNFSADVQAPTGSTAALSGVYIASIPGSASGDTYLVVGPNGNAYAVAVTPFGVTSGTGTISNTGEFNVDTGAGGMIAGTVDTADGTIRGTLTNGSTTAALVGLSEGAVRSDRLVNLSSRLRTSSDATRAMIAGFVVTGTEAKQMLIRAIGPSLSAFGVQGALANPRLQIYNSSGALVAENEDWGNNADVAAAAQSVGAFALDPASRDAAIVATLEPGAYTAQVATNGGTGVALVEVYDVAGSAANATSKQLINISTRGFVDTGDGNLIAGFVVSGNAPKRVLIRGIGPSLTQFGVQGAVANPTLKLYASGSTAVIAQNDDWSVPQSLSASQAAATAADVSAAGTAAGAFPLTANSRDAAIVITLMPGAYTAVVGDANNGTGAGLIEVYEISNL